MANSQTSSNFYEYATVNVAPPAAGYASEAVDTRALRKLSVERIFFSIRGSGQATVTLQFKCPGDSGWTDYADYNSSTRKLIHAGAADMEWRAIVKSGAYVSGEVTFGLDW